MIYTPRRFPLFFSCSSSLHHSHHFRQKYSIMATEGRRAPKSFAPLDPGRRHQDDGSPPLKGIIFDVDGTLWYDEFPFLNTFPLSMMYQKCYEITIIQFPTSCSFFPSLSLSLETKNIHYSPSRRYLSHDEIWYQNLPLISTSSQASLKNTCSHK